MPSSMTDDGAHFFRCDFQVHTPRDANWRGVRPKTEEERFAWARAFVTACRAKGLGAVAITDHHDFAIVPLVRRAAAEEMDDDGQPLADDARLIVFPGLELTLSVPCQALLILDASFPEDRFDGVLARLAIERVDLDIEKLPPVKPIDVALLSDLYEELDKDAWLRNRYLILPNVTDGGHQTLLRTHMHHKYRDMPCVGGYLDGTVEDKVGSGNRRIFDGLNPEYGNKRIALIQTSDARSQDFADLGKFSTWIKWAVPTAEALRQACLAQESRVAHGKPELPIVWISRVSVDNSMFLGPIDLRLNQEFNALIGGRGTGKSTILEYIRWALCDRPARADQDEEIGDPANRQKRLIASTLVPTESTVEVHFTINEIPHVARRNAKSGELTLKVGDAEFVKARETEVRELLPIQAYSQKQLSSVSIRIDELTRFVTSPVRRQLATIDQAIEELGARIRKNYAALQHKRQLDKAISKLELSVASWAEQASNLRDALDDVGDDDKAVLQEKPRYDAVRGTIESWQSAIGQARDAVAGALETVGSLATRVQPAGPDSPGAPTAMTGVMADTRAATSDRLSELQAALQQAVTAFDEQTSESSLYGRLCKEIAEQLGTFEVDYGAVKDRSTAHAAKLAELANVEAQQRAGDTSLRTQRLERERLGQPESQHAQLLDELFTRMAERSDVMAQQCRSLSELSEGLLRASLERARGLVPIGDKLRAAIAGSGVRTSKVEDFLTQLGAEADPLATWREVIDEFEQLSLLDEDSPVTSARFPVVARLGLPLADLKRMSARMTADSWLGLVFTPLADQPKFGYRTREDQYIDFASASPGQQATALLQILLAQPGPPLIIDQPEDDLNSEVVIEVVGQIWSAKRRRQLVFTSHNANLVVNGDAELVIHCDYRVRGEQSRGEIKATGAIDVPAVRDTITRVMEGGERAFRLRAEKYGF